VNRAVKLCDAFVLKAEHADDARMLLRSLGAASASPALLIVTQAVRSMLVDQDAAVARMPGGAAVQAFSQCKSASLLPARSANN
jgi:hypothetical protein